MRHRVSLCCNWMHYSSCCSSWNRRWKTDEDWSSSCWDIGSDMQIFVVSGVTGPILTKLAHNVATILSLGPFHGAIAVPSVTRCRYRRGHRCAGGARQYRWRHLVNGREAARSSEWAQHFSNASCWILLNQNSHIANRFETPACGIKVNLPISRKIGCHDNAPRGNEKNDYFWNTTNRWSRQCLTDPPPSGCSWTKCRKIFDADCTTSHVLNSVVIEPNLTNISHTVENWWAIKALKFQYSNSFSNASITNGRRSSNWSQVTALFPSVRLFSAETTGPFFTKLLHGIVALVALLYHAYARR